MQLKRRFLVLVGVVLVAALLSVQLAVMQDASDVGTEANPIQVYFVPIVEAQTITTGGQIMADALEQATGLHFEVFVPTSYAATIEAMCASPTNSIGFIPAQPYVIANRRCGVEVGAAAVRNGLPVYWTEYLVGRDSDIYVFGDLEGKSWAYPDAGSTSGYLYPSAELAAAGITPGESVAAGGHPQAVSAVANGDVDFATAFYSPPLMPGAAWTPGDLPEPFDIGLDEPFVNADGQLFAGDIRILDARANVASTIPDVLEKVRILRLSAPIPNDTLSFGPDFPEALRTQIIDALVAFSGTEDWANSIGNPDFYGWSSVSPVTDAAYDPVRNLFDTLGRTEEDIFPD
jgi:phosphonate transport system substrate-binding protein